MWTIETVATISEDGTITAKGPSNLPKGEHRVVIVVDEVVSGTRPPKRFPDLSAFRASLGAPTRRGNTVLEMREEERF